MISRVFDSSSFLIGSSTDGASDGAWSIFVVSEEDEAASGAAE